MREINPKQFNFKTFFLLLIVIVIIPIVLMFLSAMLNRFIFESLLFLYVVLVITLLFREYNKYKSKKKI